MPGKVYIYKYIMHAHTQTQTQTQTDIALYVSFYLAQTRTLITPYQINGFGQGSKAEGEIEIAGQI